MSIQSSEIVWRQPRERSDAGSNGGRMTATAIPTQTKNNIWPDVPQSERDAGSIKYRKVFIHVANDDDLTLVQPRVFVETHTPGDDSVTIFPANMVDTQASITGAEQQYGAGDLNIAASASDTDIEVMTEGAVLGYFKAGMTVRISDKATVSASGNEEYMVIDSVSAYTGDTITLTLTTGLANDYVAGGATRVASVIEPGTVAAAYSSFVVTSAGDGDFADDPDTTLTMDSIASIAQDWTITFTSATEFTLTSDDASLAINVSGNTSSSLIPNNTDFNKPYFTMNFSGFSGTFQTGDTITFTTTPAAVPIWYKRIIPAGANSLTGDHVIIGIDGESA